jgi:two-component system response regulator CpxR
MNHLLLIDDDSELCTMLAEYLAAEDFTVDMAHDGATGLKLARQQGYDVIILDVMLPGMNGFDVLRELRQQQQTPVLMLTARGDDIDSVVGLELGADDYLPKPCNPRVLVARLRAILRRHHPVDTEHADLSEPLTIGDLVIEPGARRVRLAGTPLTLTSTEYNILELLVRQAGHVVSKETLSEQALGRPMTRYDRSIDMHVSSLRKKLGRLAADQSPIQTVRGQGYQYVLPSAASGTREPS